MSATGPDMHRFVEALQQNRRRSACITALKRIPARPAEHAPWPDFVPPALREAFAARGATRPWSHQAAAWEALERDEDVVVVTPTASGKTLCYALPALRMMAAGEEGCALFLYPTKALSQDQCAETNALLETAGLDEPAHVYDGDTPADIRRHIRDTTRIVLSNPDMLHRSILPNHDKWRRLLSTLRWVVIDEMHTYRGVFGSHVANVLRRLRRLCAHYGSHPRFVLTSATIANPDELGAALIGGPVTRIDRNGAPAGERYFLLWNPPLKNRELQLRQSPGAAATRIVRDLLEGGHDAIVFARSRVGVEVLTRRLRESFEREGGAGRALAARISGYRGGYLPEERRRIERGLRAGEIRAVVSTNALELGIDIGSLDACIIAGYPGTVASTWQQAGRAGRRQGASLAILIAGDSPVDQYMVRNPDFFFSATPEHGRIDPDNLRILAEHLKCAAFELPFHASEGFGALPVEDVQEVLAFLAEESGLLTRQGEAWHWSASGYPASTVSLRDIADENFVIIDTTRPKPDILGEIDFESAHLTVYPQAIYQHGGRLFEVHRLDYPERKAYVREVRVDYYTQAIDADRVFVLDRFDEHPGALQRGCGEVRVLTHFQGYKKIRHRTGENIGYGEIHLPDLEKHTTAWWVTIGDALRASLGMGPDTLQEALAGAGRALHTVALVHLMCAAGDLHVTHGTRVGDAWEPMAAGPQGGAGGHPSQPTPVGGGTILDAPTIFLYDNCPGGVGFSEKLFGLDRVLFAAALDLVRGCGCAQGCPACVGPPVRGEGARASVTRLLEAALAALDASPGESSR